MSKVILLNASPRKDSNTKIALEQCAHEIEAEGVETEIITLRGKKIQSCIACDKCKVNPGQCVFDDDICNEISSKYAEADALIVGSPVYYGQPNGALLSIIQRSFHSNGGSIAGKPAAAVANNMIIVGSSYWNMVIAYDEGTALEDKEGIETIRLFGRNVAQIIKKVRD